MGMLYSRLEYREASRRYAALAAESNGLKKGRLENLVDTALFLSRGTPLSEIALKVHKSEVTVKSYESTIHLFIRGSIRQGRAA